MDHTTSVGPEDPGPDGKRETRATTEGVDAQNATEFDIEHGLAGVEAKPFSPAATNAPEADLSRTAGNISNKGSPGHGLVSERRTPGRDDGVNATTADGSGADS